MALRVLDGFRWLAVRRTKRLAVVQRRGSAGFRPLTLLVAADSKNLYSQSYQRHRLCGVLFCFLFSCCCFCFFCFFLLHARKKCSFMSQSELLFIIFQVFACPALGVVGILIGAIRPTMLKRRKKKQSISMLTCFVRYWKIKLTFTIFFQLGFLKVWRLKQTKNTKLLFHHVMWATFLVYFFQSWKIEIY